MLSLLTLGPCFAAPPPAPRPVEAAGPSIRILSPAEGSVCTEEQVCLRVRVASPGGGRRVRFRLLGSDTPGASHPGGGTAKPIPAAARKGQTPGSGEFELLAGLREGENFLTVVAVDDQGRSSAPASIRLEYRPEMAGVSRPSLYVLAIGVAAYRQPQLSLAYAAKDARDFASVCRGQEGKLFRKIGCRVLADGDAPRTAVLDGLDWLTARDWCIVFISGRGIRDDRGEYYFAPEDVDPARLRCTAIRWSEFSRTLEALPGKRLLILDTCQAAATIVSRVSGSLARVAGQTTRNFKRNSGVGRTRPVVPSDPHHPHSEESQ